MNRPQLLPLSRFGLPAQNLERSITTLDDHGPAVAAEDSAGRCGFIAIIVNEPGLGDPGQDAIDLGERPARLVACALPAAYLDMNVACRL